MAGTAVSFDGALSQINVGNVGVAPGTSISGNYRVVDGSIEDNIVLANKCASDTLVAYNDAAYRLCSGNHSLAASDLAGMTLISGVYCTASGQFSLSASNLTLDAQGNTNAVWIFQTDTTLKTATATYINLVNGANAKNVYWQIGSSATIGYTSYFADTILAYASITYGHDVHIQGRALAQAAVSFEGGSVMN